MGAVGSLLAGQLVEITDLRGHRIMAIFGSDNGFVFEHTNPNVPLPPLLLRDMDHPVFLGSFAEFIQRNNLFQAMVEVADYIETRYPERSSDTLLLCRVLKLLHQDSNHINPTKDMIEKAFAKVLCDESELLATHELIRQIAAMATGEGG